MPWEYLYTLYSKWSLGEDWRLCVVNGEPVADGFNSGELMHLHTHKLGLDGWELMHVDYQPAGEDHIPANWELGFAAYRLVFKRKLSMNNCLRRKQDGETNGVSEVDS